MMDVMNFKQVGAGGEQVLAELGLTSRILAVVLAVQGSKGA
eukprot:CAMPEP_0115071504 /NCGR_PEP_ID=MMETSP0227-20121206/13709_1 /TAXON_ID=89957 /ORGANISM="Polarella glacialis, Strain CCMP 1383" /LENGTH=40 /DNA_ID= /DNA_START= /DNA_END= /DNA_ORIENTATION=